MPCIVASAMCRASSTAFRGIIDFKIKCRAKSIVLSAEESRVNPLTAFSSLFCQHRTRNKQIVIISFFPRRLCNLLMRSPNDGFAGSSRQVAYNGCFNKYFSLHKFNYFAETVVCPLFLPTCMLALLMLHNV